MSEQNIKNAMSPVTINTILEPVVKDAAKCVSVEEFERILKDANLNPEDIRQMYQTMQDKTCTILQKHTDKLLHKEDIINMCRKYNELVYQGMSVDGKAWRPPGNVSDHMKSLYANVYIEENEKLQIELNRIEKENELIMEVIKDVRKTMKNNIAKLLKTIELCKTDIAQMKEFIDKTTEVTHNITMQ